MVVGKDARGDRQSIRFALDVAIVSPKDVANKVGYMLTL